MPVKPELAEAVLQLCAQDDALAELRQKIDDLKTELNEKSHKANNFRRDMIGMVREKHRLSECNPDEPLLVCISGDFYLITGIHGDYMDLKARRLHYQHEDRREIVPSSIIRAGEVTYSEGELAKLREDLKALLANTHDPAKMFPRLGGNSLPQLKD